MATNNTNNTPDATVFGIAPFLTFDLEGDPRTVQECINQLQRLANRVYLLASGHLNYLDANWGYEVCREEVQECLGLVIEQTRASRDVCLQAAALLVEAGRKKGGAA